MERKQFLTLCQYAAVYGNAKVKFAGQQYIPTGYLLTFDDNGNPQHTAQLYAPERNCYMSADLEKVEEVEA